MDRFSLCLSIAITQARTSVSWPFLFVVNSEHQAMKWALINGPLVTFLQQNEFSTLRRANYRFIGMSSYKTFPRPESEDSLDYETVCEGWCHCFRSPENFLFSSIPRALISHSDFTDHQRISPLTALQTAPDERFDVVYVGSENEWKKGTKNWALAAKCIPLLCRHLNLRVLVIGTPTDDFPSEPGICFCPSLPWERLLMHIAAARCVFVPNVVDASPRVIAEALCLNTPVVVNRHILGGWKYVNRFTGTFFEDQHDIVSAVRTCINQAVEPRSWFCTNFGPYLAGRQLLRFLTSIDPQINERSHVWLSEQSH